MKKIVAGTAGLALALSLAACGGSSTPNEAAVNDAFANETVFNDELPADLNAATIDNGTDAALIGNGTDNALTATDNAL